QGSSGGVGTPRAEIAGPEVPLPLNPARTVIPVARIADMLLAPGQRYAFNGRQYSYPDIRMIYWAGGNPFHHHQDLNRLQRAWQKPQTVIVHETCGPRPRATPTSCSLPPRRSSATTSAGRPGTHSFWPCIAPSIRSQTQRTTSTFSARWRSAWAMSAPSPKTATRWAGVNGSMTA